MTPSSTLTSTTTPGIGAPTSSREELALRRIFCAPLTPPPLAMVMAFSSVTRNCQASPFTAKTTLREHVFGSSSEILRSSTYSMRPGPSSNSTVSKGCKGLRKTCVGRCPTSS